MASINWQKMTRQKAGAMIVHLGKEERMKYNHSNKDIDKDKSYKNSYIGCKDYSDALKSLDRRNKEVDAIQPPKRKKKDRVTACMLEFTCPLSIQAEGRDEEFFNEMYAAIKEYLGEENVHGMFIHRDEQHYYTDMDGDMCLSLYHAHVLVSPYTEEHGINGKNFETRQRLKELNKKINDKCIDRFDIEYNTNKLSPKMNVEKLKAISEYNQIMADVELAKEIKELKDKAMEEAQEEFEHQFIREKKKYYSR